MSARTNEPTLSSSSPHAHGHLQSSEFSQRETGSDLEPAIRRCSGRWRCRPSRGSPVSVSLLMARTGTPDPKRKSAPSDSPPESRPSTQIFEMSGGWKQAQPAAGRPLHRGVGTARVSTNPFDWYQRRAAALRTAASRAPRTCSYRCCVLARMCGGASSGLPELNGGSGAYSIPSCTA